MAYQQNKRILAADINDFNTTIDNYFGNGSDLSYGYGLAVGSTVVAGEKITSNPLTSILDNIQSISNLQGTTLVDNTYTHTTGSKITFDQINNNIQTLITNYGSINDDNLSNVSSVYTYTTESMWSTSIDVTIKFDFTSEQEMHWFFNSGGKLSFKMNNEKTVYDQDIAWETIYTNYVGEIIFGRDEVTQIAPAPKGTMGIGFQSLTVDYLSIYTGSNLGSGAYSGNDVFMFARKESDNKSITISIRQNYSGSGSVSYGTEHHANLYQPNVTGIPVITPTITLYSYSGS